MDSKEDAFPCSPGGFPRRGRSDFIPRKNKGGKQEYFFLNGTIFPVWTELDLDEEGVCYEKRDFILCMCGELQHVTLEEGKWVVKGRNYLVHKPLKTHPKSEKFSVSQKTPKDYPPDKIPYKTYCEGSSKVEYLLSSLGEDSWARYN
jgi:hypothetical protein